MSTRANIVIKDENDSLWFYRHSDGYPEGTLPTLKKFMRWLQEGRIRNNVTQAAGWLVVIGNEEYRGKSYNAHYSDDDKKIVGVDVQHEPGHAGSMSGWKVGAYEPTIGQHGDIDFLYTLDLTKPGEIEILNVSNGEVTKEKV